MKFYSIILALAVLFGAFVCDASAQTNKRKKTTRRTSATRPAIVNSAQIIEPEIISRASDTETTGSDERVVVDPSVNRAETGNNRNVASENTNSTQTSNSALQRELNALRDEVKNLRENKGVDDLEKLTVAEERAENFRRKLEDTISREAALNSKLQELDLMSQPEAIQRETAVIGSTRPEDIREARRKQLEFEKTRVREQLNQVQISRARLEAAIANADALVEKLRTRVESDLGTETAKPKTRDAEQKSTDADKDAPNEESEPSF